jgi:RimJ/RimL family protein N-acetyltransferase
MCQPATMQISLRPATDEDYDFLWWLHCATLRSYVEQTWGWDEHWQAEYFRDRFDPTTLEIIESDGAPIGCISVERREDCPSTGSGPCIFLGLIEVAPDHQNRGIGTKLIRALLDEADRRSVPVELRVIKANHPARRLYERLGFAVVGETETHYLMRWPIPDGLG